MFRVNGRVWVSVGFAQNFAGFSGSNRENRGQSPKFSGEFGSSFQVGSIFDMSNLDSST